MHACMKKRKAYKFSILNSERKELLDSRRHSWVDNINMNLREARWDDMNWTDMIHVIGQWKALINKVMNFRVSWNAGEYFSSWVNGDFSRRTQLHAVSHSLEHCCHCSAGLTSGSSSLTVHSHCPVGRLTVWTSTTVCREAASISRFVSSFHTAWKL
jgi:hypothetical protein